MSRAGQRLVEAYDLVILDLDGVVYLVDQPIPGAVEVINRLHGEGRPLAYATNNASRRAGEVADLLSGMGVPARPEEVLTSASASVSVLAQRLPSGSGILVVGAPALRAEVRAAGLRVVSQAADAPAAVVQGYGPRVGWSDLAEAAVAVRAGALWVATNLDRTLPSDRGPLPGNGALVAALRTALDREPDIVVGKPDPELFVEAARRAEASRPLVVGDRLDTDVEGAVRAGFDSLLVLTGVTGAPELLHAPPARRPTYLAPTLSGLFDVAGAVCVPVGDGAPDDVMVGGWRVTGDGRGLRLAGSGTMLDALRALCTAVWAGGPADVHAGSADAGAVLRGLGLAA